MTEDQRKTDPFAAVPADHQPPYVEPADPPYTVIVTKHVDIQPLAGTPGTSEAVVPPPDPAGLDKA